MIEGLAHQVRRCDTLSWVAGEVKAQIDQYAGIIDLDGDRRQAIAADVTTILHLLDRLKRGIERPRAIAVFGESLSASLRVGASLLTQRDSLCLDPLPRSPFDRVCCRLSGRDEPGPAEGRVSLCLLPQAALIEILGHACCVEDQDPEGDVPGRDGVDARFHALTQLAREGVATDLTAEAVRAAGAYFERHFPRDPTVRALAEAEFWGRAAELAPVLPSHAQADLFGLLWRKKARGDLYRRLSHVLHTVSFARTVAIDPAGLTGGREGPVTVHTEHGAVRLDASSLAALTETVVLSGRHVHSARLDDVRIFGYPDPPEDEEGAGSDDGDAVPPAFTRSKLDWLHCQAVSRDDWDALILCREAPCAAPPGDGDRPAASSGPFRMGRAAWRRAWHADFKGRADESAAFRDPEAIRMVWPKDAPLAPMAARMSSLFDPDRRMAAITARVDRGRTELIGCLDRLSCLVRESVAGATAPPDVEDGVALCGGGDGFGRFVAGLMISFSAFEQNRAINALLEGWGAAVLPSPDIRAGAFADLALREWHDQLVRWAGDVAVGSEDEAARRGFVRELLAGAARLDIRGRIETAVRPHVSSCHRDLVRLLTRIAAVTINRFAWTLGSETEAGRKSVETGIAAIGGERSHVGDVQCRQWVGRLRGLWAANMAADPTHTANQRVLSTLDRLMEQTRMAV